MSETVVQPKTDEKYVTLKIIREPNDSITFEVESHTEDFEINCAVRGVVELFPSMAQEFLEKGMEIFAAQLDEARKEIKKNGDLAKMPVLGEA